VRLHKVNHKVNHPTHMVKLLVADKGWEWDSSFDFRLFDFGDWHTYLKISNNNNNEDEHFLIYSSIWMIRQLTWDIPVPSKPSVRRYCWPSVNSANC